MFVWIYLGCGLVGGRPQGGRGLGRMRRADGCGQEVHAWWSVGGRGLGRVRRAEGHGGDGQEVHA